MSDSIDSPPPHACPACGGPLSAAAGGMCPRCLMEDAAQPTNVPDTAEGSAPPALAGVMAAFPQFEIVEYIGKGGMGSVWKARQPTLNRHVALKLLPASLAERDPAFAERFAREGQLLARLHHPNIVAVHDSGRAAGFFYLVMEFVDGVNLRQAMRASRFTPQQALAIVPKICDALQYAHDEGVLHRDIKPENILLDAKGRVKLVDFGIAKLMAQPEATPTHAGTTGPLPAPATGSLTLGDSTLGTPNYMAPEQIAKPSDVDNRADIYSLGVVFYELLTGELPLGKFAPPSERSTADPRLDGIVRQALEKERGLRQQSVGEMRTQVQTIAGEARLASDHADAAAAKPRFSITAIVGACWAILFFAVVPAFIAHEIETHEFWRHGPFASVPGFIVWFVILIPAFIAPFGATLLGWIAITKIRRPAGKLYGMWLAVFDGLLFPLLALDAVIGTSCAFVARVFGAHYARSHVLAEQASVRDIEENHLRDLLQLEHNMVAIALLVAVITVAIVDYFIVRRVWRAVNGSEESGTGILPAVGAWLTLTDHDRFAQSWDTAAPYFQRAMAREEWVSRLQKVRHPLGTVLSREMISSKRTGSGRCEVKFKTSFDGLPAAMETVTLAKQADGEWLAAGYLIRPTNFGNRPMSYIAFYCALVSGIVPLIFYWLKPWAAPWLTPHGQEITLWLTLMAALLAVGTGVRCRNTSLGRRAILTGGISATIWLLFFVAGQFSAKLPAGGSEEKAQVRYRAFEADADLVDKLVPPDSRMNGDSPGGPQIVNRSTNVVPEMAEVDPVTLTALSNGMSGSPGLLMDQQRDVPFALWPDLADAYSGGGRNWGIGIGGALGVRREHGGLQFHLKEQVTYNNAPASLCAELFYEGSAPPPGHARTFFIPFANNTGARKYLVVMFEVSSGDFSATPAPPSSAHNLSFGPVMEREIPFNGNFIDFQSGRTFMRSTKEQTAEALGEQIRQNGIDASAEEYGPPSDSEYERFPRLAGIVGLGAKFAAPTCVFVREDVYGFENARPEDAETRLKIVDEEKGKPWCYASGLKPWWFRTLDGAVGIVQITGTTSRERPLGLVIRYKLVQKEATPPVPLTAATGTNPGELKSIPPEIGRLWVKMKADVDARLHAIKPDDAAGLDACLKEVATNTAQIITLLRGTIAEPFIQKRQAALAALQAAKAANDDTAANTAMEQIKAAGDEMEKLLVAAATNAPAAVPQITDPATH